jgi:alpha-tubulin suppressor-like RCC1 family protein
MGTDTDWDGDNIRFLGNHSLLRKTDSTLWTMGSAGWGKLGLNAESLDVSSPTQIPGTNWSSVAGGNSATVSGALKSDGSLWLWGKNDYGVLGQNAPSNSRKSSPTQVPGSTWSSASVAPSQVNAVKTDGTLWTWGDNSNGRHGLNTPQFANQSSPVQVPGTWTKTIATDSGCCFGWKSDTELWSWGYHGRGTIGQGTYQSISSPVQIPGSWPSAVGKFSSMHRHAGAVKSDGTLWTWGWNAYGQLGQNQPANSNQSSPTQIPGTTWDLVESGSYNMLAKKTDGTLWAWGYNTAGALGLGNKVFYSSPTQVGTDTSWVGPISAAYQSTAVIGGI